MHELVLEQKVFAGGTIENFHSDSDSGYALALVSSSSNQIEQNASNETSASTLFASHYDGCQTEEVSQDQM